jgi:hypothetical protein
MEENYLLKEPLRWTLHLWLFRELRLNKIRTFLLMFTVLVTMIGKSDVEER